MSLFRRAARSAAAAIEAYFHADTPDVSGSGPADVWGSVEARRARYALAWSLYQNTAFRDLHDHAEQFRRAFGLYRHVRNIYSPVDRIVEFAAAHIYGSQWDADAGDGKEVPSAAPIAGDAATPALRAAIARLWRDSMWPINAEAWVRSGALNGDAPVKVVTDVRRGKVLFQAENPKHFKSVDFDAAGHVRGYVIERVVPDPRPRRDGQAARTVIYEEHCERDGELVVWRTYLVDGGTAIGWDWTRDAGDQSGGRAEWSEAYGFVPMVWTKHVDAGLPFGLSEFHTARPKIVECDDQASKLNDQIRKVVEPKWLYAGFKPDDFVKLRKASEQAERDDPEAGRRLEGFLSTADPNAKGQPLVAPLQIADALANVVSMVEEIERGFPELRFDRLRAGGDVSGESLRVARQPVETKIARRRARYDVDLVRLHQMGAAIGGELYRQTRDARFDVFAGFGLDSYAAGTLDHQIGPRPVFGSDPFESEALRTARYTSITAAKAAGIPHRTAMREAGYTDEQIDAMEAESEQEAERNAERMATFRAAAGFDNANPEDNGDDVPPDDEER